MLTQITLKYWSALVRSIPQRSRLATALPTINYYHPESHLGLLKPYAVFCLKDCLRYKLQVISYIHISSLCFTKYEMVLHWCLDFSVSLPFLPIGVIKDFYFQGLQRAGRMKSQVLGYQHIRTPLHPSPRIIKHTAYVLGKITFCFRLYDSWELYFTLRKYFTAFVPRVCHYSEIYIYIYIICSPCKKRGDLYIIHSNSGSWCRFWFH